MQRMQRSAYEQEHGDLNAVSSLFDGSICADEKLFIYLDKSYHPCDKDDAAYKVIVSRLGQDAYGVQKADIEFIAKRQPLRIQHYCVRLYCTFL